MIGIIYSSKNGTTQKIAELLYKKLDYSPIEIVEYKKNFTPNLSKYKIVILGSSIYTGKIKSNFKKFINNNLAELLEKKCFIFLICMEKGEKRLQQFEDSFPEELRKKSIYNSFLGGEFNFDKMNFFEKIIVKKITGIKKSKSFLNYDELEKLVKSVKEIL